MRISGPPTASDPAPLEGVHPRREGEPGKGGLHLVVLSGLFFSFMSLLVKAAGRDLPTMELVFARALVVTVVAGIAMMRRGMGRRTLETGLLLLRGIVGFAALSFFYYSVIHLPLAEATLIHFTNPVFTSLIAALLLGERLRRAEFAMTLAGLAGVAVVVQPTSLLAGGETLPPLAVASALAAALFSASAYVTVRRLRHHDATVIVFAFAAVSVVIALPLMLPSFVPPHGWQWPLLLGIGLATYLGQLFLTMGLQREPAGRATSAGSVQVLFATAWGAVFFGDLPRASSVAGGALIVVSVLLLARLRERASPPSC